MERCVVVGNDEDAVASLRRMAGLATPMALRVAVTLGLPDRLRGDGAAADDLAAELGVAPVPFGLLLDHLATLGIVERTATGYRTTEYGAHLCTSSGNDLLTILLNLNTAAGRAELAFVELAHSVATGESAYAHRYGLDFWSDLGEQPRLRESFDQQMHHRIQAELPQIVDGVDWSRFARIVDVGGGAGTVLAAILAAHPHLRAQLVDLEPTATQARDRFLAQGLGERAEVIGRSFFEPLPAGADAYLLVDIVHNWDDEHAGRVLGRCAEAAAPDGRVLVVEAVGGRKARSEMSLAMLVIFGGRERTVEEVRALGSAHGLVLDEVVDLTDGRCLLEFTCSR